MGASISSPFREAKPRWTARRRRRKLDVLEWVRRFHVEYPVAYDPVLNVANLYLQGGFPDRRGHRDATRASPISTAASSRTEELARRDRKGALAD